MNVLKLPCQGASRSVTSLPPKKQHMQESGPVCQVPEQGWQGSLKNGPGPPTPPQRGSRGTQASRPRCLRHGERGPATASASAGSGILWEPSPGSLRDLFLLPSNYHLLGKWRGKLVYINKGHGEIWRKSAFKTSISKHTWVSRGGKNRRLAPLRWP